MNDWLGSAAAQALELATRLPEGVRPGTLAAAALSVIWLLGSSGIRRTWDAALRGTATIVHAAAAVALLPEYVVTTARRRRDQVPGPVLVVYGKVAESILGTAGAVHERHARRNATRRPFPYKLVALPIVLSMAVWLVMERSADSGPGELASDLYQHWRFLEAWAAERS